MTQAALLGGAALLSPPLGWAEEKGDPRLVRGTDPLNLEFPFATLKDFLTPTALHYIRNHYPVPKLDPATYTLHVSGAVAKKLRLTLADLKKFKPHTLPVTMECAGNGRSFLPVKVKGVQWAQGAVSTAEWTGARLSDVLQTAGVQARAVEVIFDSADKGDPRKEGQPPVPLTFSRSISLNKAASGDVLLAYAMNGKELPPNHGFPVRAIVPGWYGCASVKWLTRVIVTRTPFLGFDQTLDYSYWANDEDGLPRLTALTEMQPKAQIATPIAGATLPVGKETRLFGAAWAGEHAVETVEISSDGGKTWSKARLLDKATPFCWQRWEATWTPPVAGKVTLMARATDVRGRQQPMTHDAGRRSYMINFVQSVPVTVA